MVPTDNRVRLSIDIVLAFSVSLALAHFREKLDAIHLKFEFQTTAERAYQRSGKHQCTRTPTYRQLTVYDSI